METDDIRVRRIRARRDAHLGVPVDTLRSEGHGGCPDDRRPDKNAASHGDEREIP